MLKQDLLDNISLLMANGCSEALSDLIRQAKEDGMCECCYVLSRETADGIYAAYRLKVENEECFIDAVHGAGLQVKEMVDVQENGFKRCLAAY